MITNNPKKVLVLMSDTGGGHRAAAEAIEAAAAIRYPGELVFTLVDVFRDYTPFPFKYAPEIYPAWVNHGAIFWYLSYLMTNARRRSQLTVHSFYLWWRQGVQRMLTEHPADVILCVHSIISRPIMKTLMEFPDRPPFVTVVTDLVSTHAFWYDKNVDRCLVPTHPAYQRGLYFGLRPEQMRITGLPVHPRFMQMASQTTRLDARRELGLDEHLPVVMLVSGGEGMGPLFKIAETINQRHLKCQLVIVAGRNQALREKLEANIWNQPTKIYGFVDFMPKLMVASDMLVTKAGPATISEALIAGLPIIISGAIPGQEEGNVEYVVRNNAGVYAPSPRKVADTVEAWLKDEPEKREYRARRARALARPDAVWEVADEVYQYAQRARVPVIQTDNFPQLRRLLSTATHFLF